ncbi:hypothetical protein MHU86_2725 [Fragilaria crotonensis]|nr:hypothetical protein MHU86_2725 [Fragilaria crotonensis]
MAQPNLGDVGVPFGQVPPLQPGVPPAGGPAVVPGALPQAGAAARTYREHYLERGQIPPRDRVAGYLAGYRFADVGGGVVPTAAALRDLTVTLSDRQPMTFLCLVPGTDGHAEVAIVHRFLRYLDTPGDDPTGYNDKVLGLLGDIPPHQYPVVEIPNTAFHLVAAPARVPTIGAMNALLATWEDPLTALGPYTDQDPETEVVRPRNLQLVTARFAALLVHWHRVRAKDAYQEVVGAIQAEGVMEPYNDVITWLRAACTARGGGGPQNTVPSVLLTFTPLFLPPDVYEYVTSKVQVQAELPALSNRDVAPGTTEALVGAIRALTAPRGEGGDAVAGEGERNAKEPKSVSEAYRETYRTLLRFSNVEDVTELAPVWQHLANCLKSEQHTVLTQEFQKVCMARGLSTKYYVPVVTTALKQMVVGFQFVGFGSDDLTSGCQPFLVSYAGRANHYQVLAAADVGNQLAQGEHTASLTDYKAIRDKEKVKLPRDVAETCITLFRFAVLCQALFQGTGPTHPLVETMWTTAVNLQNLAPAVTDRYQALVGLPGVAQTYFARIVRAVQLGVHEYLQGVATNLVDSVAGIERPSFTALLQDLRRGTFHQSTNWIPLPPEYLGHSSTTPHTVSTSGGSRNRSAATGGAASGSGGTTVGTAMSSLTPETPPQRESVARIENPAPDNEFAALTLRTGGTRTILRANRPPANDAGNEFCVAWWTRSGCYPNCGRRNTHQPLASTAERARLMTYVRQYLVVPSQSPST